MYIRLLSIAAIVVGLAFGVTYPSLTRAAGTGRTLTAVMEPPTFTTGGNPFYNCGWHAECGSPPTAGTALDWQNTPSSGNWYFRGFFANSGPTGYIIAQGYPVINRQDGVNCNIMTVWVIENYSGKLRAAPTYYHTVIDNSAAFDIYGGSVYGVFYDRAIGHTVNDAHPGTCTNTGLHVHEDHVGISGTTTTRNTALYLPALPCNNSKQPGVCCASGQCYQEQNNLAASWTRKFVWPEGS